MLLVTTEQIAGRNVEPLGIVEGSSIQTVHAGKDIMNSLKTLVGGELTSYTEMMEKARKLATDKMVKNAQQMGADEIRKYLEEKFADVLATKNKGQIMKAVMGDLKGKADGKLINQVVADLCK